MIAPMSERFVKAIERFTDTEGIDLVSFEKGQRKDDVAQEYRAKLRATKACSSSARPRKRRASSAPKNVGMRQGKTLSLDHRSTALPNHYYFYIVDRDFGPLFIKFCSYFPYAAKLCLNGHEWLKRQLTQRGIPFEPLDNGIRSTDAARRVQQIADTLTADKIDAVFRKWLRRLPHPFTAAHRKPGYRYQLSILQAEFALTQVLDRPQTGRGFFEEVIRENLDIGRPDQMQLIFNGASRVVHPAAFGRVCSPKASCPLSTCSTRRPRSSSTTKKGKPFAPKPPSTILMTSRLVVRSAICPRCGRSASPPTDACCASNI